ncbi:MAG: uroporphyrinogen decarboxylase family protein [Thermoguttaceae bacterium]
MTSRERVLSTLRFQPTDRGVVDFGGHRSSGIAAIAYAQLKKYLGISSGSIYVYDMVQQLAIVEPEILDLFGADVVELGRGFGQLAGDWQDWVLPDGTPCKIPAYLNVEQKGADWYLKGPDGTALGVQRKGCLYFEQCYYPLENRSIRDVELKAELSAALGNNMWGGTPTPGSHFPLDEVGLAKLREGAARLRGSTDRAIIALFGGNLFELPQWTFRMDSYLMQLGMEPDAIQSLSESLCELHLQRLERWLPAIKDYVDVILFGDDLGGQRGPLLSPTMYRRFFKPYHARMWNRVKEIAPHLLTNLHCCGGVEPLLEDMIEAGLDSINPVQITCSQMDAGHLRKQFGGRLGFWGGGCDTRSVLPKGTPEEVRSHVLGQLREFVPRNADGTFPGGFIFQQVHNIMADVPPENIVAMFRAVNEFCS